MSTVNCKRKIDTIQFEIEILERHAAKSPVLPYGYKQGLDDLSQRLKNVQNVLKFEQECGSLNRDVWGIILQRLTDDQRAIVAMRRICKTLRNCASPFISNMYFSRRNFKKCRTLAEFDQNGRSFLQQGLTVFPNVKTITIESYFMRIFPAAILQTFFDDALEPLDINLWEGKKVYKRGIQFNKGAVAVDLHRRHSVHCELTIVRDYYFVNYK